MSNHHHQSNRFEVPPTIQDVSTWVPQSSRYTVSKQRNNWNDSSQSSLVGAHQAHVPVERAPAWASSSSIVGVGDGIERTTHLIDDSENPSSVFMQGDSLQAHVRTVNGMPIEPLEDETMNNRNINDDQSRKTTGKRYWLIRIGIVLMVIGLGLGLGLGLGKRKRANNNNCVEDPIAFYNECRSNQGGHSSKNDNSAVPCGNDEVSRYHELKQKIFVSLSDDTNLESCSAANLALLSMSKANPETTMETTPQEMFALLALYFATNGPSAWDGVAWSTAGSAVCEWDRVICDCAAADGTNECFVQEIHLERTGITGQLPSELGLLTDIRSLNLANNNGLTGTLPSEIGSMSNLQHLNVSSNAKLGGTLPSQLWSLRKLETLDVSILHANGVDGHGGTIDFPEIGQMESLRIIHAAGNKLSGTLPPQLFSLPNLTSVSFEQNFLSGSLPSNLCHSSKLQKLNVERNYLLGTIPSEIGDCSRLEVLSISYNRLTGTIPTEALDTLSRIRRLSIGPNFFDSSLFPGMRSAVDNLEVIDCRSCSLIGTIPSSIWEMTSLQYIVFGGNDLTGQIPSNVGLLTELKMLSLTANNLNGTLPTQIGQLESSVHFGVTSNRFTGSLPSEIGVLKRLIVFHIAENGFTGVFPESLGQLALMGNLKSVDVQKNQFDGTIPRPICDILVYSEGCEHPAANP